MSGQVLALAVLGLATSPLVAQEVPISQSLDSGTVVRLGWSAGPKRIGQLLAPLTLQSASVVYCRYPGPPCGQGRASNAEVGPVGELVSVEVRRGDRSGRGALLGAGLGLAVLSLGRWAFADADSPAPWTGERVAGAATVVGLAAGIGALVGRGSARWVAAP
jgi:hypothetical protein